MSQKSTSAKDPSRAASKGGGPKSKSGFLARQVGLSKKASGVKEADLLAKKHITPEDVMGLEIATKGKKLKFY